MRTVFCQRLQQQLPGLAKPPFPGPKGQHIFDHVSAQAWQEWLEFQRQLINEKHLELTNPDTRKFLMTQMDKYLAGENFEKAEGYKPSEQS